MKTIRTMVFGDSQSVSRTALKIKKASLLTLSLLITGVILLSTAIYQLACRLVVLTLAFVPGIIFGESFPEFSVDYMCDRADLIVEGTVVTNDMVRIETIYKRLLHFPDTNQTITVNTLSKHTKSLWTLLKVNGKEIETKKVVLFLEYGGQETNGTTLATIVNQGLFHEHGGQKTHWTSIATIDDGGWCGSCGLFWYDDAHCYGYRQMMNPEAYGLETGSAQGIRVPATIEQLRAEIKIGVTNSSAWKAALALTNPKERAAALVNYLTISRPANDKGTYLHPLRGQMVRLGKDALDVLIPILENPRQGDALDEIVLIIYDLGPQAKAAVPALCKLLSTPGKAQPGYILDALQRIKDPSAIPCVRPFLKNEQFFIAVKACNTLGALDDRESFDEIAALFFDPRQKDPFEIRDLLNVLHDLDREKALPIIQREARAGNMAGYRDQIKGWRGEK